MAPGILESVEEEDTLCADDLRRSLIHLRQQYRAQSRVLASWKARHRQEKRTAASLAKQTDSHLKTFQSDLVVFESQLKRSRTEFQAVLKQKEETIEGQYQVICDLSIALVNRGGEDDLKKILPGVKVQRCPPPPPVTDTGPEKKPDSASKSDTESSNDADSAIMMEDAYDSMVAVPTVKGDVKVMRSISDALEVASRATIKSSSQHTSSSSEEEDSRTVFTVHEEVSPAYQSPTQSPSVTPLVTRRATESPSSFIYDSEATLSDGLSDNELSDYCSEASPKSLLGSYEKLNNLAFHPPIETAPTNKDSIHMAYNRVMSNHRNVTKPKDVKYKRINKAKSRSLEELRGKLKFWDPSQTICMDIGQSEV